MGGLWVVIWRFSEGMLVLLRWVAFRPVGWEASGMGGEEGELLMGKRHVFSGSMWLCLPTTSAAFSAPQCETDDLSVDVVICKHR